MDYKNTAFLKNFLTERAKILPSRISGTCASISENWQKQFVKLVLWRYYHILRNLHNQLHLRRQLRQTWRTV